MRKRTLVFVGSCALAALTVHSKAGEFQGAAPAKESANVVKPLSEATKKQIYWEGFALEHKADREANARYPIDRPGLDAKTAKAHAVYGDQLIAKYDAQLRKKYGITDDQYIKIVEEGIAKKWPTPSSDQ